MIFGIIIGVVVVSDGDKEFDFKVDKESIIGGDELPIGMEGGN